MHRIQTRLFLVLASTGFLLVLAAALAYQLSFHQAMVDYLTERERLRLEEYAERLAERYPDHWSFALDRRGHPRHAPRLPRHMALEDDGGQVRIGTPQGHGPLHRIPIQRDGQRIGMLVSPLRPDLPPDAVDQTFETRQLRTLMLTTAIALLVALLGSWRLARYLVRPITAMTDAARRMANGDYQQRLPMARRDELGVLGADINHLAQSLELAARARDRWLADVSHELRTPLAILQGELEALIDGIRPLEPARLESLHQEILHLRRLIDDLHDLALADAGTLRYRMDSLDLRALVQEQWSLFLPGYQERQIVTDWRDGGPLPVRGDATRLRQLLANLLSNSVKYTDPDGRAELVTRVSGEQLVITLDDSAPGVEDDALARLFDHLYRAESASRNRELGGSGLGLALARRIAEAHGGRLEASASALGGLRLTLTLPRLAA